MMEEILLRFAIGGGVVSTFAVMGDLLKPKSFAGLFGASPAIALATLALTVSSQGASFAAVEARSMIAGAAAFFAYARCVSYVMMRHRVPRYVVIPLLLSVWFAVALTAWAICLR